METYNTYQKFQHNDKSEALREALEWAHQNHDSFRVGDIETFLKKGEWVVRLHRHKAMGSF